MPEKNNWDSAALEIAATHAMIHTSAIIFDRFAQSNRQAIVYHIKSCMLKIIVLTFQSSGASLV